MLCRVLRVAFAHNSKNVIGAPLASHLLWHKECFIFSHNFAHLPVNDILKLLQQSRISATFCSHNYGGFFESRALHYLCRSSELHHLSVFDFFTHYSNVYASKRNRDTLLPYENMQHFTHPSIGNNRKAKQGIVLHDQPVLPKIQQWALPDTTIFNGDILDLLTPMTATTEKYARFILILFLPHWCDADLTIPGSSFPYSEKLCQVVQQNKHHTASNMPHKVIFDDCAVAFLNNVENSRTNCLRCKVPEDDLCMETIKLNSGLNDFSYLVDKWEDKSNEDLCETELISSILNLVTDSTSNHLRSNGMPQHFHLGHFRKKSRKQCGQHCISKPLQASRDVLCTLNNNPFITTVHNAAPDDKSTKATESPSQQTHSHMALAELLLTKTSTVRRDEEFKGNPDPDTPIKSANGMVRSIIWWAKAASLDDFQRRAFEITVASFLLTFFREADLSGGSDCHFLFWQVQAAPPCKPQLWHSPDDHAPPWTWGERQIHRHQPVAPVCQGVL